MVELTATYFSHSSHCQLLSTFQHIAVGAPAIYTRSVRT